MSKNFRRDYARGERRILGSRTAKNVSDGSAFPRFYREGIEI